MKNNFIKAFELLQERFEWHEKNGASQRTIRENLNILRGLSDYFENNENREMDLFRAYSSLLEKFQKRTFFIQMHGYSDYALNWIDNANVNFMESEVEYRRRNNLPMRCDELHWIDLEANQRIVIAKAENDIKAFKTYHDFKARSVPKADYSIIMNDFREKHHPYINFEGTMPTLSKQIKFHSFRYEQCN